MHSLDKKADFCRSIIVEAGAIALEGYGQSRQTQMKGPQDYLTETDGRCEEFLKQRLAEEFPEDGFFGEEGGGTSSHALWVVDPIDGTANFARNIPHFCIAIAYIVNGTAEIGAIYNPVLNELHFAQRGRGASRNGAPISVSGLSDTNSATVELGWSTRIAKSDYMTSLEALIDSGFNVRRAGSGALGLAYVADGRNDAYAEAHMNSWDCVAGLLMVQEAGGLICSFEGTEKILHGGPVLAATPLLASAVSSATGIALKTE